MSRDINQNVDPLFIFEMPDDEVLANTISVKGEKGEKGDPTKLSDLENDEGFIDNTVDDLANYYTKTATDGLLNAKLDKTTFNAYQIPSDFFTSNETASASGDTISISNTANALFKSFIMRGNTTQSSAPTPSTPVPIKTATGAQKIVITDGTDTQQYDINLGKNIFNKNADVLSDNCYLPASTTSTQLKPYSSTTVLAKTLAIRLNGGETYTIQKMASARFRFGFATTLTPALNTDGVIKTRLANADTASSVTFTVPTNAPYLICNFFSGDQAADATNGYENILNSIQIEKGETATTYTDYKAPIEMCDLGEGYRDYFHKSNGKWYKHKAVGKAFFEDMAFYASQIGSTAHYRMWSAALKDIIALPASSSTKGIIKTNVYDTKTQNDTYNLNMGINVNTSGYVQVYDSNYDSNSSTEFMSAMQGMSATIYYALAEPVEEEITDSALISQLDATILSRSYDGSVAVSVTGILPLIISLEAFKNGWSGTIGGVNNEIIGLLEKKADKTELGNYYTKTETDALIADTTNPIYYGADPTGVADSADAINACIQANKGGAINFSEGTYLVNSAINLPFANDEKVSINGNGATIKTTATLDALIVAGYDRASDSSKNDVGFTSYIKDLILDGQNGTVTYAIKNLKGFKDLKVINCRIYRFTNGILIGESTGAPADILVSECMIYGKGSEYDGAGIVANCTDNNINMCRIYGFRKGFVINGYCIITRCHVLLRWAQQTTSNFNPYEVNSAEFNGYYEPTMFAELNVGARILSSYCDSMYNFATINTTGMVTISACFYYNARSNVNAHLFAISVYNPRLTISDCSFSLCKNDDCRVIVNTSTSYFHNDAQFNLTNNLILNLNKLTNAADLIMSSVTSAKFHDQLSLDADTWYVAKIIANVPADTIIDGLLYIGGWPYDVVIKPTTNNIYQVNASANNSDWSVGYVYDGTTVYICVKPSVAKAGIKIDFNLDYSTYQCFAITPVNGGDYATSTRLLSDYTDTTPTTEKALKQTNYV